MQVQLTKPELEQFISDRVKAGDYPNAEAVVESALAQMMQDKVVLTDEDIDAINRADAQFERGEGIDFDQFEADARKKYGLKP